MIKPLKIILSIVASLVFLVMILVGAATFLIDPNSFKPEITTAVKNKINRNLVIEGDIKLAFFPVLAITTGKITLSNATGFEHQAFATLEESHISIALLPLLSEKIEVSGIVLQGLVLNLTKNQQGINNWDDLVKPNTSSLVSPATSPQQLTTTNAALGTFAIGALTLVDAQINWKNTHTGKNTLIKDLNLTTDKVIFDQPVTVDLAFVSVNAGTQMTDTVKLTTSFTINKQLNTVALNHSNLQVTATGETVPNKSLTAQLTIVDAAASLPSQSFKVTGLQLKTGDLTVDAVLSGNYLNENAVFQGAVSIASFSPAKLMKDFAIKAPVMRDATALNKLAISFDASATKASLNVQNLVINLDDALIKGSTSINNFAAPAITFNLAVDTLDVDRYLPPVEKTKKPITSPTIALTAGASSIPVETLRKLNANGDLTIATLKVNELNLQDVHFHLAAKDGVVTTAQTIKQFYQGDYAGNLTMDVRNAQPVLAINEKLSHVQIDPLLNDFRGKATITGTLDAAAQLQGRGNTAAELKASLNGYLKFLYKDGAIIGFNLQNIIDKGKSLLKGTEPVADNNEQTPFFAISGAAAIQNGLMFNNDLLIKTAKVQATGNGTANLVNEQLNYKLTVNLLKEKATATEPDRFHAMPVVVNVGGTFSNPTYNLDVSALLTEKTKERVETVIETLKTDENKAKVEKVLDNLKPEDKEKLKTLAPKLGKLFKKLF
ncbi:MAG: AsmA family protein [Gammaproteobacteria bacterium]|nr:AsmA family protein [Gammaproteobacteria bacterium]